MATQKIGKFLGINNRLHDFALSTDSGQWLREAENVDITNAGNVVRRRASALVQAVTAPHSLFGNYLVRASALYAVTLPDYTETLAAVLTSNAPMSYCKYNGDIYYSNGVDSGRIATDGSVYPWALPTPSAPTISAIVGSLLAGTYKVAISYTNSITGEEGGISASSSIALAATGGVRVTLPASVAGATHVNIYLSAINGNVQFKHSSVTAGTVTVDITSAATGREANQRFEAPLPAGTRIFMFNGRLCSVSGKSLFYSLPHRPGYAPLTNRGIVFENNISMAMPNQMGVYVAAGNMTHFLQGTDIETVEIVRDVLPHGAVPGTEFAIPGGSSVGWFGANGIVVADTQGLVSELTADAVDVTAPESGISTVLETRGYIRVVSCGYCVNLATKATTTYTGWEFTSTSNGYGTSGNGVYALEGDGVIDAHISLGKENFGSENLKHLPTCYLGVSSDEPIELRVTTPSGDTYEYEARDCDTSLRMQRVDVGKGLRANWFDLAIHNVSGSDFTLATVSFAPAASGRRI